MRLNKTEREALQKKIEKVVIPLSNLEIFNHTVVSPRLSQSRELTQTHVSSREFFEYFFFFYFNFF